MAIALNERLISEWIKKIILTYIPLKIKDVIKSIFRFFLKEKK